MPDKLHVACAHCGTTNRVAGDRLGEAVCGSCGSVLVEGKPVELTAANFDRHIAGDLPVVVDFWAAWCGPCRMMAPAFEQAAAKVAPAVRLGKLDTEAAQDIAARFNIRSIPTLVAFRNGREVARQSGAMALPQLLQWIQRSVLAA